MTQRQQRMRRQMARSRATLNRPPLALPLEEPAPAIPRSLQHVLVVQTYVVDGGAAGLHFQIHVAADDAGDAVRTILLTKDQILYDRALRAEGSRYRFAVAWHTAKRPNGAPCLVLDRFDEEPT